MHEQLADNIKIMVGVAINLMNMRNAKSALDELAGIATQGSTCVR